MFILVVGDKDKFKSAYLRLLMTLTVAAAYTENIQDKSNKMK